VPFPSIAEIVVTFHAGSFCQFDLAQAGESSRRLQLIACEKHFLVAPKFKVKPKIDWAYVLSDRPNLVAAAIDSIAAARKTVLVISVRLRLAPND
jgi:hypothetical protein